jgi:two-component system, OmpR family, copper resistance phosphate regulon response regulator CusR
MALQSYAKTVLVIEDDRPISLVIKGHLEGAGYRVLWAGNGIEGLALARTGGVDLITLDVLMHPMDGWAVFQALRDDPATQNIPIVFITIFDEHPEGLIAQGYLKKPFQGRDLLYVVGQALKTAQLRSKGHGTP